MFYGNAAYFGDHTNNINKLRGQNTELMCVNLAVHTVNSVMNVTNCEVREKTDKMQQLDVYYQHFLNMFRASLRPSSGDQDVCYCTWCAALVLLDVVGSGCGALCCRVRAL